MRSNPKTVSIRSRLAKRDREVARAARREEKLAKRQQTKPAPAPIRYEDFGGPSEE
jgi:hypothetical protein